MLVRKRSLEHCTASEKKTVKTPSFEVIGLLGKPRGVLQSSRLGLRRNPQSLVRQVESVKWHSIPTKL
jgi:hypothetical protein